MATSWICLPLLFGPKVDTNVRLMNWRSHAILRWWEPEWVTSDEWVQSSPTAEQRARLIADLDPVLWCTAGIPMGDLVHRIAVAWALEQLGERQRYQSVRPTPSPTRTPTPQ